MSLTLTQQLAAISTHSEGLAAAAGGHLDARVEHCPDWSVADLVWHVAGVHWFWGTIARERITERPDDLQHPDRPGDELLVPRFLSGLAELLDTLADVDQDTACWTWFPPQQNVAFISRHQVQEAAVHHFDAANASGADFAMDPQVAADCVEEFLTTSLAEGADCVRLGVSLPGDLVLAATDLDRSWRVSQTAPDADLLCSDGAGTTPTVSGTTEDLLLWLYERRSLQESDPAAVEAFRRLTSTD